HFDAPHRKTTKEPKLLLQDADPNAGAAPCPLFLLRHAPGRRRFDVPPCDHLFIPWPRTAPSGAWEPASTITEPVCLAVRRCSARSSPACLLLNRSLHRAPFSSRPAIRP